LSVTRSGGRLQAGAIGVRLILGSRYVFEIPELGIRLVAVHVIDFTADRATAEEGIRYQPVDVKAPLDPVAAEVDGRIAVPESARAENSADRGVPRFREAPDAP